MCTPAPSVTGQGARLGSKGHWLEIIVATRASVGDGLNDQELTQLMRESTLLSEAGFGFLSFSDGAVTLSVPEQDLKNWYPEQGWIAPEKERVARGIAEKHGFSLYEPVDKATSYWHPPSEPPAEHHHLELSDRWQTVVVAHPQYLKVRLFGNLPHYQVSWEAQGPLRLGPDLLKDLSALYRQSSGL